MNPSIAWHYTTMQKYPLILESCLLKPADAYVADDEKPILWFSTNLYWEQTANKALRTLEGRLLSLTMEQTAEKAGGLVRFAVPLERLVRWPRIGQQANVKSKIRKSLEATGIRAKANYMEWYGTLESMKLSDCVGIEFMDMATWTWESKAV